MADRADFAVRSLERISSVLVCLDHSAMGDCLEELEAVRSILLCVSPRTPQALEMRPKLLNALALARGAADLCAGFTRIASIHGAGYTSAGTEPEATGGTSLELAG
jgi:hypothetical protein